MKIAIVTDTYKPQINGVVTSINTFAESFKRKGHEVIILAPATGGERSTKNVWRFASVAFPFHKESRMSSPLSPKLLSFAQHDFDVIHIQTPFSLGLLGQYLGWTNKIPTVYTYHTVLSEYLHYVPLPKPLTKKVEDTMLSKQFCNRCAHIIAPSTQMKNMLRKKGVRKPISVIPTGVQLPPQPTAKALAAFRKKFRLSSQDRVMTFVARLGKEKNVYFLLHCFSRIHSVIRDAKLLIVGDGPERAELETLVRQLGLKERVVFTGFIPHAQVPVAYHAAELVLFPSVTETQGLSLLEGMATGRPAVCINATGVSDVLKGNQGGYLTRDSVPEYSDTVIKLLKNKKLRLQKGLEAKERAKEFSADAMATELLKVYEDIRKRDAVSARPTFGAWLDYFQASPARPPRRPKARSR